MLGNRFLSGSRDGSLKVWDLRSGNLEFAIEAHEAAVTCMTTSTDDVVFTGSADHTVKEFDIRTVEEVQTIHAHSGPVRAVQCDETRLVSGSFDRTVRVYDKLNGTLLKAIDAPTDESGSVRCLHFSERGIYSGWLNGSLMIYDFTGRGGIKH